MIAGADPPGRGRGAGGRAARRRGPGPERGGAARRRAGPPRLPRRAAGAGAAAGAPRRPLRRGLAHQGAGHHHAGGAGGARGDAAARRAAGRWLPGFAAAGKGEVTPRHLLAHSSGLPWWRPYHEGLSAEPDPARRRAAVVEALLAEPLEAPPATRTVYSDPGFMALGLGLEAALGAAAAGALRGAGGGAARAARHLLRRRPRPGGRGGARGGPGLRPDPARGGARAPAGHGGRRQRLGAGRRRRPRRPLLHRARRGGHRAGLARRPRRAPLAGAGRGGAPVRHPGRGAPSSRALGWDTRSPEGSTLGTWLGRGPRGALGHLAFTGCSLWLDLDAGLVAVLLTNHVHPAGSDRARIHGLRRRFHDAVAEGLGLAGPRRAGPAAEVA